jgi:hypothetical protein
MTDNVILYLNKKSLKKQMKTSKLTFRLTFIVLCIPIVFHGTLKNVIIS